VIKRGHWTFSASSQDGGECDAAASLDDLVALIDPWSNDLLKRRSLGANRLTTLCIPTGKHFPKKNPPELFPRLTCPLLFKPALKHVPSLATRIVCARPVAAETNLTPGGHPRFSGRIFIVPSSQTALIPCRPSADDAARPQRWATPWISIATAWELQLEVWTEVIFAVRSGRKKCGVIRSGLDGH
jgi:hypothetical protein